MKKLRLVWFMPLLFACSQSPAGNDYKLDAAPNPFNSELRSLNQTIRNFQDLLKKNPDEKVFAEYAEILERKTSKISSEFDDEIKQNSNILSWIKAVENAEKEFKNKSADARVKAQRDLSEMNEKIAVELKLN